MAPSHKTLASAVKTFEVTYPAIYPETFHILLSRVIEARSEGEAFRKFKALFKEDRTSFLDEATDAVLDYIQNVKGVDIHRVELVEDKGHLVIEEL